MKTHCFIISWDGQHSKAAKIASCVQNDVNSLTIIYSNKKNDIEEGDGKWVKVPNEWFYGRKFQKALEIINKDELMLVIQADADYENWEELVKRCKNIMHQNEAIGIWAPDINNTPWKNNIVSIVKNECDQINFVTQTDGIVFAYSPRVIERLKKLDYTNNNIGWGIDWISICHAYTNNMFVVRDTQHMVKHAIGSGYPHSDAIEQMNIFINQMTPTEMIMYKLLNSYNRNNSIALK